MLLVLYQASLSGTTSLDDNNSTYSENDHELLSGHKVDSIESKSRKDAPAIIKGETNDIFQRAIQKAIGGGIPGAVAGVVQVLGLMWLVSCYDFITMILHTSRPCNEYSSAQLKRTVINYQYRYGSSFLQSLTHLYTTGGLPRLYAGLPFALIQAPLVRFVSTAANDGVSLFLQNNPYTVHWGPAKEVAVAAVVVGLFRGMLMPIDTCKTVLQIQGGWGFERLMKKVRRGDVGVLYAGAVANAVSSFIGE
jgi:hypothetical protein